MIDSDQGQECYLAALRLLSGRDYTTQGLQRKLQLRGFAASDAKASVERLVQEGYLNDRRYADCFITTARENGRFTGIRLLQELRRRGVPSELLDELLREQPDQDRELEQARRLVARHYSNFNPQLADDRERRRIAGFLQRRGYRMALINSLLDKRGVSRRV